MSSLKNTSFIGIDVGGTSIDAGAVTGIGELVGPVQGTASPTGHGFEEIVSVFARIALKSQTHAKTMGLATHASGIAMPGPFDYERGVSHMQHKFKSLFGQDIKTPLQERLGHPVFFINDADAFGLGISHKEYPSVGRLLCVTLGTGVGSAFIVDGRVVNTKTGGVPDSGEIWNLPFKGGILEDKISKGRLLAEYKKRGGPRGAEVKHIVESARSGDSVAAAAVAAYAQDLGEGLAMVSAQFRPSMIVFGGRISGGLDVFAPVFEPTFKKHFGRHIPYAPTRIAHAAIHGAARHASQQLQP